MYESSKPFTLDDLDERYVRRDSHEYQQLLSQMSDATKSTARIERYLVGGFDEQGHYQMGLSAWVKVIAIGGALLSAVLIAVLSAVATHALKVN